MLEDTSIRVISHLARFYSHLIGQDIMPVSCLKTLTWESLSSKELLLADLCLGSLLTTFDEERIMKIFRKLKGSADLDALTTGVEIYLKVRHTTRTSLFRLVTICCYYAFLSLQSEFSSVMSR